MYINLLIRTLWRQLSQRKALQDECKQSESHWPSQSFFNNSDIKIEIMSGGYGLAVSCASCLGSFGWALGILHGLSIIVSLCQAADSLNAAEQLKEERDHLQTRVNTITLRF